MSNGGPTQTWWLVCCALTLCSCARPNPQFGLGQSDASATTDATDPVDSIGGTVGPVDTSPDGDGDGDGDGDAGGSGQGPDPDGGNALTTASESDGGGADGECGDDVAEGQEACDGRDLRGETCASLDLMGDGLECADDCTYDLSGCSGCGNGRIDGREACDPTAPVPTCDDLGWDGGETSCTVTCGLDDSECYACGDGLVSGPEECDTEVDFACSKYGWDAGVASCDACLVDLSGCCNTPGGKCNDESDCCEGECLDNVCSGDGDSGTDA